MRPVVVASVISAVVSLIITLAISAGIFGGAVVNPGVYRVAPGTRLYEVVELAGGLRSDADTYSVNQAAFVEDGELSELMFENKAEKSVVGNIYDTRIA